MTLDEAIEYYINVATRRAMADEGIGVNDKWKETKFMTKKESEQIIADNRQLAEWLKELKDLREEKRELNELKEKAVLEICRREAKLKEAKQLLEVAVEDLGLVRKCQCCKHQITGYADICYGCHVNTNKWEWRYADEAEKLLNDEK